jgi:MFS family permease
MALPQTDVQTVVHSIQLSVAPVFLLSGVGVLLGVLTNRLSRIIDRARPLEEEFERSEGHAAEALRQRLTALSRRARLINAAITLSTISALLVATVVALLFASAFVEFRLALAVAALFVASMLALVGALIAFLVEVRIATVTIRIGPHR